MEDMKKVAKPAVSDKYKNWKSTGAFFTFVGAYIYTLTNGSVVGVVETSGYIALYSSLFMMLRAEATTKLLDKLTDRIK